MKRDFPLADVLTVLTGICLSKEGIGPTYLILNYLTRDEIFTHQIPRALTVVRPWVAAQYPELAAVDASGVNRENALEFLAEQQRRFGATLPLEALPGDDWQHIDPIEEAERIFGAGKVIAVAAEERRAR